MQSIIVSLIAIFIVLFAFIIINKFRRIGLLLIFINIALYALFNNHSPSLFIFSIRFEVADVICALLSSLVIVDILKNKFKFSLTIILLFLFGIICIISLLVGVLFYNFGLGVSVGHFRNYFYFFSVGYFSYSCIVNYNGLRYLFKYWYWTS
jgi:hypothetical protein